MSDETPQPEAAPKRRRAVPGGNVQTVEAAPTTEDLSGLPNAIDIDARKITGPVLTKQGWVVPDEQFLAKQRKAEELKRELGL